MNAGGLVPKVNVYLPDDLAEAVRESRVPVSAVCQKALSDAVRQIGRTKKAVEALRNEDFDMSKFPKMQIRMALLMTPRLKEAIRLADAAAGSDRLIGTNQLLIGMIEEGSNLGMRSLEALGVDTEELRSAASRVDDESIPMMKKRPRERGPGDLPWDWLTNQSRFALASMLEVSIDLGHNYLGCEHLLIALTDENTAAGNALADAGVERASAERAVRGALAGYVHAREVMTTTDRRGSEVLAEIVKRLDSIESRLRARGM
jgi:ATP-dependent Clp protease ATP-binding subunit ClpA